MKVLSKSIFFGPSDVNVCSVMRRFSGPILSMTRPAIEGSYVMFTLMIVIMLYKIL